MFIKLIVMQYKKMGRWVINKNDFEVRINSNDIIRYFTDDSKLVVITLRDNKLQGISKLRVKETEKQIDRLLE